MKTKKVTLNVNKKKNTPKMKSELLTELQKKVMGSNSNYFKFCGVTTMEEKILADKISKQFDEQYDCNALRKITFLINI